MKNVLFGVSYLGTNYAGWQKQDNALGIQEVVENAMKSIGIKNPTIYSSGRTDAGVHALEQCFNAHINFSDVDKLPMALNSHLPEDIRILWAKEVDEKFHARFNAHKKTYMYRIKMDDIQSPFDSFCTTYVPYKLDLGKMQRVGKLFEGEHDFEAFCSVNTTTPDFVRTIYSLTITQIQNLITFEICGSGFLYNMVRIIVGTLIDVGRGKLENDDILNIFKSKNRQKAGKTMPAKGLILKNVEY